MGSPFLGSKMGAFLLHFRGFAVDFSLFVEGFFLSEGRVISATLPPPGTRGYS